MVILKVGRSATGARATLAHTGALIRNDDAFKGFVARYGIPVVGDYEELIATLEAFAVVAKAAEPRADRADGHLGRRDRARLRYLRRDRLAAGRVSPRRPRPPVRAALPGLPGQNPLDIGQSVGRQRALRWPA